MQRQRARGSRLPWCARIGERNSETNKSQPIDYIFGRSGLKVRHDIENKIAQNVRTRKNQFYASKGQEHSKALEVALWLKPNDLL